MQSIRQMTGICVLAAFAGVTGFGQSRDQLAFKHPVVSQTTFEQVMLRNMATNSTTRVTSFSVTNLMWTLIINAESNHVYRVLEELELSDHWTKHYSILPFSVNDEYVLRWQWLATETKPVTLYARRAARPRAFVIVTKEEVQ